MYYIYEIKGVKVGCTSNFERRQKQQRSKGEMILLEECTTIEEATRRERDLQAEKGYKIDCLSYNQSIANGILSTTEAARSKHSKTNMIPILVKFKGKLVGRFEGIKQCSEVMGFSRSNISAVLGGRQKTTKKHYTFEYADSK